MPDSDADSSSRTPGFRRPTRPAELTPSGYRLYHLFAGRFADLALEHQHLPHLQASTKAASDDPDDVRDALLHPFHALNAFFAHYAFARRGKDREDLGQMATAALRRVADPTNVAQLLAQEDGGAVWDAFCQVCAERRRKNSEQLNRGLIAGMVELAQEIYRLDGVGSIAGWVADSIAQTDRIEGPFLRIVDIRGVGPKTTSTFLRDVVYLFDLEDQIDHADRLYVQPVDRWLRLAARHVVPEDHIETAVDWIIAGKVAKYARRAGVSGVRANMGSTYFGSREVREQGRYDTMVDALLDEDPDDDPDGDDDED